MNIKDLLIKMNQESQNEIITYITDQAQELQDKLTNLPYIKKVHYDAHYATPKLFINDKKVDDLLLRSLSMKESYLKTRTGMLLDLRMSDVHLHAERVSQIKELAHEAAVVAFQHFHEKTHGLHSIKIDSFYVSKKITIYLYINGKSVEFSDED